MPPEAEQAPEVQDTPAESTAAPDEGNAAPESPQDSQPAVDYQKRYDDLVPAYTQGQQLIAAARGDHGPEAQIQALQQLGVEVEQQEAEEDDDLFDDPSDRLAREMEQIKQNLAQRDEQEQHERFQKLESEYIDNTLKELEGKEGIKLSEREKRFVVNDALTNRHEDGRPDLEGAVALAKELRGDYTKTKSAPRAPVGAAGEAKIDFSKMSKDEIDQWMAEDIESRMAE